MAHDCHDPDCDPALRPEMIRASLPGPTSTETDFERRLREAVNDMVMERIERGA